MRELDQFQLDSLTFLDRAKGRAIIGDPMGSRKTATTLAWLATQPPGLRTIVVAPSAVHGHWEREAGEWYARAVPLRGQGTKKQRLKEIDLFAVSGVTSLYITTYESMKQDQHPLQQANVHAVVFDEGHRLKGRTNQVGLCANAITKNRPFVICVTGTPVLNHPHELWQYLHMLNRQQYPAFWKWAETHFAIEMRNFKGNRFPTRIIHDYKPGHAAIVREQLKPYLLQRDLSELFVGSAWIAEPDHIAIDVDLSAPERKLYTNMVKFKWGITDSNVEVTTKNPLDLTTRLTQMASDWGTLDSQLTLGSKSKAAIELTLDLIEREEPVLIFAKYKATVARLVSALLDKRIKARAYTGDLSPDARDYEVKSFAGGETQVLVGTLDSMSEGVDGLQERCSTVIMLDHHWTPAKNDQAIGRIRRSGQLHTVTVYHVFANGTIDATIADACLRKVNVVQVLRDKPLIDAIYGR